LLCESERAKNGSKQPTLANVRGELNGWTCAQGGDTVLRGAGGPWIAGWTGRLFLPRGRQAAIDQVQTLLSLRKSNRAP